VVLLLGLIGAAAVWHASWRVPAGPDAGTAMHGEVTRDTGNSRNEVGDSPVAASASAQPRRSFRVATFNIHSCKGMDGRRDVDRVADCVGDFDLVALNEVRGARPWEQLDQAGQLGTRLGLAWLFAPSQRQWHSQECGNGLLSAPPVSSWQRIPLQRRTGSGYRNMLLATVQHGGRAIHVLLTHVARSDRQEREEQLRTVIAMYRALAGPSLLLGDLNSGADDPQVRDLLATPGVRDPVGETLGTRALPRIDWIITRGLRPLDAGIRETTASDHPVVWAELE
jgi:endonuclease/exonuclease/phosphatase family metal-dependent hydrolase